MTTERRFLHSTVASYGSQLGRTVLRLATDLTLARLILPEQHGLFALAWSTVVLAGFVRDLGLPYELVRHRRQPYGSVLIWEVGAGLLVTTALIVAAPLFGGLDPNLPDVLRVLSVYVLIEGLAVVPRVFFERELAVTKLVAPEIGRGVVLAAVSITLASRGAGVWSFVIGELAASICFVAVLWWLAKGRMPMALDAAMVPQLLRGSIVLFVIALIGNSTPFVGRYMVEIVDSTFMVGQFEKAFLWAMRAQVLIVPALVRALYPALVAYSNDRHRFVSAYRLGTTGILAIEATGAYFIFFNADVLVLKILLGENWVEAAGLIRILCLLPLIDPFNRLGGEMLKARREDRIWLVIALVNLVSLVGFGWVLSHRFGVEGMAWAHYLMLGHFVMAYRVYKICGSEFGRILRELVAVYALPLPFFLAAAILFPPGSWSRFAASVVAAALVGGLLIRRFHRPLREFFSSREPA
jgi:PST family polysaccharide transporter